MGERMSIHRVALRPKKSKGEYNLLFSRVCKYIMAAGCANSLRVSQSKSSFMYVFYAAPLRTHLTYSCFHVFEAASLQKEDQHHLLPGSEPEHFTL